MTQKGLFYWVARATWVACPNKAGVSVDPGYWVAEGGVFIWHLRLLGPARLGSETVGLITATATVVGG